MKKDKKITKVLITSIGSGKSEYSNTIYNIREKIIQKKLYICP